MEPLLLSGFKRRRLVADVGEFAAGNSLDEQRHEISQWSTVELSVIAVHNGGNGVRRDCGIAILQPVNNLTDSRPFA